MEYLKNKYQQIKQLIMAKTAPKVEKTMKPVSIKEPAKGLPTTEKDWADFAKKNNVKLSFFCIQGIDFTRNTKTGIAYLSGEQFEKDGGTIQKIHYFTLKK